MNNVKHAQIQGSSALQSGGDSGDAGSTEALNPHAALNDVRNRQCNAGGFTRLRRLPLRAWGALPRPPCAFWHSGGGACALCTEAPRRRGRRPGSTGPSETCTATAPPSSQMPQTGLPPSTGLPSKAGPQLLHSVQPLQDFTHPAVQCGLLSKPSHCLAWKDVLYRQYLHVQTR